MPVIPDFQPAAQSGSGFAQSQSLMQRASANRRQEEAAEMDRQKFEIMRPVLESQARVQLVSEANDLTAAHIVNNSIANDLQRFPDYVKQWTESATIEDPKERLGERRRILGAITPFAAIKSTAPMVKAFQEQFAQDANADKTADVLSGRLEVAGAQNEAKAVKTAADNETKLAVKQKDLELQQAKVEAAQQRFEQQQAHAAEIAKMRDETARRGQDIAEKTKTAQMEAANSRPANAAAGKANDAILISGQEAAQNVQRVDQALALLDDPELRTGTGAGFIAAAKKLGGVFGMDTGNVKNLEQLQNVFGDVLLSKAKQMRGSFSDKDRVIVDQMSPSVAKTPEGNRILLRMVKAGYQNTLNAAALVQEGRSPGASLPETEVQWNVNHYFQNLPPLNMTAPTTTGNSSLTPDEQSRLQELRAKRASAGR